MLSWAVNPVVNVNSFNPGRDLIGVQNLMKKHQALLAEIAGHEPRISNVCQTGNDMIKEGHFAADTIREKTTELKDRWQALKVSHFIYVLTKSYEFSQKMMNRER